MEHFGESSEKVEEWKKVDVREVDMDTLVDIRDVNIDMDWPREKRIEECIRQITNPYCFKVGKVAVKVEFSEGDATFEDRVKEYLESL